MSMDKTIEEKQWVVCWFCGSQKIPDERVVERFIKYGSTEAEARFHVTLPKQGYTVCPNDADGKHSRHAECLRTPFADGAYYFGLCRNARVARYVAASDRFVYMREKFDSVFPEGIGHAENDNGFDLFRPYGIMNEPPFEIPADSTL